MFTGRFRQILIQYINHGGCLRKKDLLLSVLSPGLPFFFNAKKVTNIFAKWKEIKANERENKQNTCDLSVELQPCRNHEPHIETWKDFIPDLLENDLVGAYIHGSTATGERIAYSDVDALIIIKDEVFQNPRRLAKTAYKLNRALKYFYKIDPLQHHGWFVLTESDLLDYPQTYFPAEIFKYSKSLFPDKGLQIELFFDPKKQDYQTPFMELAAGVRWQLEKEEYPKNMYQLKGLLSRFMLLPALYCQARDEKGIFKKFSFRKASQDFPDSTWSIMDEVSGIRSDWHQSLNPVQKYFLTRTSPIFTRMKRKLGPEIPKDLRKRLVPDFYERMLALIDRMEERIATKMINDK